MTCIPAAESALKAMLALTQKHAVHTTLAMRVAVHKNAVGANERLLAILE
jgi:hypothetical protein